MKSDDVIIMPGVVVPASELEFRTSRSGGPGGQNVNKVESKVELLFDVSKSSSLSDAQRARLFSRLGNRIDTDGVLHLSSQVSRSQWENKEIVVSEFARLLKAALKPVKKRVKTRPSKTSREKRLKRKKIHSEKKKSRSGWGMD
ncbi:MAG TPA: alternative ribosome rescue aminoacyl-tRNA hydrolase ArfB [Candidatus Kryptobacter bacterium]|nr:alternative ribosome rescue aminoacyl-tRNA hydrolase ArfB [Candidatus Kryptobacter bacterium]